MINKTHIGWTLNNNAREPFVDFIKGLAIVFVVLTHCLVNLNEIGFPFWGSLAVPVFLIIQSWHVFKQINRKQLVNAKKVFVRIILPFFAVEVLLFAFTVLLSDARYETIKRFIRDGGCGPGSYYVWIYVQFAFCLLPLSVLLLRKVGGKLFFLIILFTSILLEIFCCLFDCPFYLYRLAAFRYVFLIWLGYDWAHNGLRITWVRVILSLISVYFIYLFQYRGLVLTPYFFDYWQQCHWVCYFYPAWLFVWIIRLLYECSWTGLHHFVEYVGRNSYWIFLNQLIIFTLIWYLAPMPVWIRCVVTISCSILPPLVWQYLKNGLRVKH